MYLEHYKMTAKPFSISADSKFLWLGEKHREALAVLKYGVLDNKGFLLLTGDVGTGKTTLIHALLKTLGENVLTASVPDSGLDRMDFYNYITNAFRLNKTFATKGEFLIYFEKFLRYAQYKGLTVLLIIDEAQRLSLEMLEEIRVLSNFERDGTKLLNIFFVGQNEFNDILTDPRNKALRQRITISYNLKPLSREEIKTYIEHRLAVAGVTGWELFTETALEAVYRFSGGYPRRINVLCDHALLTGFVRGVQAIEADIIEECAGELEIPGKPQGDSVPAEDARAGTTGEQKPLAWQIVKENPKPGRTGRGRKTVVYLAAAVFVFLAIIYWIRPELYARSASILSQYVNGAFQKPAGSSVTHKVSSDNKAVSPNDPMP